MSVDTRLDRTGLAHFLTRREVIIDPVDTEPPGLLKASRMFSEGMSVFR